MLLQKLIKDNDEKKQIAAFKYLYKRLKIGKHRGKSMQDYFDKHYKANCYYYSTFILMCMKPTDRLVRGCIHIDSELDFIYKSFHKGECPNYEHGWIEFEFNNMWWVYDDHYKYPIPMDEWYKLKSPYKVYKKFTQTELLEYVKENYPDKIIETKNGNITYISTESVSIGRYNLPLSWFNIIMKDGKIVKFEHDKEMKECLC